MRYAKVIDGVVTQIGLPETMILSDGRTVSGFDKLPESEEGIEILIQEGWLPMEDGEIPEYDPETQHLVGSYDVREDKIVVNYIPEDLPPPPEPVEIVDVKAQAIAEIEAATTIAGLRAAMLKYINAT